MSIINIFPSLLVGLHAYSPRNLTVTFLGLQLPLLIATGNTVSLQRDVQIIQLGPISVWTFKWWTQSVRWLKVVFMVWVFSSPVVEQLIGSGRTARARPTTYKWEHTLKTWLEEVIHIWGSSKGVYSSKPDFYFGFSWLSMCCTDVLVMMPFFFQLFVNGSIFWVYN